MKQKEEISLYEKLETIYLLAGIVGFIISTILHWWQ